MRTQWDPLVAESLKLLLDEYYEIETEVPVSELPRKVDLLVIHRQKGAQPHFEGLWSHLTDWNILKYKGPNDTPHDDDLERLVHVGTGLTYKLNENLPVASPKRLPVHRVSFWYIAPSLSQPFIAEASRRTPLKYETGGVWSGQVWGHPIWLVSVNETPIEVDTIPLRLIHHTPTEQKQLSKLLLSKAHELKRFAGLLYTWNPDLWKEIQAMALLGTDGPQLQWEKLREYADLSGAIDCLPPSVVIDKLGVAKAIETIGRQRVIETIGAQQLLADLLPQLTAAERQAMLEQLQKLSSERSPES